MKKITLFISSIIVLVLLTSTITFMGGKVKIDANGKVTIDTLEVTSDYLLYEMPHCFFRFNDTTGATSYSLDQNAYRNINGLTDLESHGIEYVATDTSYQYTGTRSCHMLIDLEVNGTTASANDDIWVHVKNITDGTIIATTSRSSSGNNNYGQWRVQAYDTNCNPNDKYVIQMCNKSNSNDFVKYRVSLLMKVLHFEF